MPLMHAEDLEIQELALTCFDALRTEAPERFEGTMNYAQAHYDIIKQFGRYPHRNDILGRTSTQEEVAFLEQPGSSF